MILSQTVVPCIPSIPIILNLMANWCMMIVNHNFRRSIHLTEHNNNILLRTTAPVYYVFYSYIYHSPCMRSLPPWLIHDDENDCYISSTVYASKRCHGSRFIFGSQSCTALIFNIITSRTLIPHHGTMTFILVVGLSLCTIIYYAQLIIWLFNLFPYYNVFLDSIIDSYMLLVSMYMLFCRFESVKLYECWLY